MWMITNRTAYAACRSWIRDKQGVHHFIVAVRGTFTIGESGTLSLADEQVPPKREAEYFGEPGRSSIRYEADLGPMKPTTDVTVLGSAYAPRGRPVTTVIAGFSIASIKKSIEVFGERVYHSGVFGLSISRPAPFTVQPIRYEAAYGGMDKSDSDPTKHLRDSRNPVGRGIATNPRKLENQRAHTLEYYGTDAAVAGPAGLGPIASYWSPRREYAGTYDEHWSKTKRPLLPDDYDDRFTLCAPRDQQLNSYLHGGELLELMNLSPGGVLRLTLPKISFTFSTDICGRIEEHPGMLVSVIAEPDDTRLSLVWQTSLPVRARDVDYLERTIIRERCS